MVIQGYFYDCGSAASCPATLQSFGSNGFSVQTEDGRVVSGNLKDIQVSDRLGNVERKLTFADGAVFASPENDAIDLFFKGQAQSSGFLHFLESRFSWAAVALVVTVVACVCFFRWGVPWISTTVAHALPNEANEFISKGSLEFLDEHIFEASKLDPAKQNEIREHFRSNLLDLEENSGNINYRVHFRNWSFDDKEIPNAFALPSGDIILTDKFVQLAENQDEIDAVLLHEMGHVVHRHSLETVVGGALIAAVVMMVTGDNSAIVDAGLGVGALLVNSSYSRENETEADLYAFEKMLDANIDPGAFSKIMNSMETYMSDFRSSEEANEDVELDAEKNTDEAEPKTSIFDYLSSHPSTQKRIEQARIYSECYKQGLNPCEFSR